MTCESPLRAALDAALLHPDASDWPPLDDVARRRLLAYLDLLARWNRRFNLTAVRDPADMLVRHLLDSLSVAPALHGCRLLDAGTGAGLPGLVLAMALPERRWVLLDAALKKTRFCRQAALELGLPNVEVVQTRLQDLQDPTGFDTVVSRAVGKTGELWRAAARLLRPGGRLLAMKGRLPSAELEELRRMGENPRALALRVPGLDEPRHVVVVESVADHGGVASRGSP